MRIASLHTYPVKSARGISHDFAMTDEYGFAGDRNFMVVSPRNNMFITQRNCPKLACLRVETNGADHFVLSGKGNRFLSLSPKEIVAKDTKPELYGHFKSKLQGFDCGDEVADFLTDFLDMPARLVWMGPQFERRLDKNFDRHNRKTGYADGYPFLLATVASLNAVRAQMEADGLAPIGMDRFRPNIVVEGDFEAFVEDRWRFIQIGDDGPVIELLSPCTRCAIPSTDQATGERPDAMLVRDVLQRMGRWGEIPVAEGKPDKGPLFGMNAALGDGQKSTHIIQIGQNITVLERYAEALWLPVPRAS